MTTQPAEVFHPSEMIADEIKARGWSLAELAVLMGGDFGKTLCALDLYMAVAGSKYEKQCWMGDEMITGLARAFQTSKDVWENLERAFMAQ